MTQIPLLVKEKVQFYYYRQEWSQNIKMLHKEYNEKAIIKTIWGIDFIKFDKYGIIFLNGKFTWFSEKRWHIYNFFKNKTIAISTNKLQYY